MKQIAAILLVLTLAGCTGGPLSLLTGGGPNVAANVQAGKENNQAVVQYDNTKDTSIEGASVTVHNTDVPLWVILLLVLGWVLPSPREIARGLLAPFKGLTIRKKDK